MNEKIDFGFQSINIEDKVSKVHDVFASVADNYDIMNDVMSGGLHRIWKDKFVGMINPVNGDKLLDLAGGTGDIGFRFLKRAQDAGAKASATITDINEHMLEQGKQRAIDKNILHNVDWNIVNAEEIPYEDNSFNFCTIAFGIRNVTDRNKALSEIYRILKPEGRFLCLEFSHLDNPTLQKAYDLFSFNVIPKMGELIAGDRDSYQYLVESIRQFPTRGEFTEMIEDAGFKNTTCTPLTQGVVAIHSGYK